MKFLKTYWSPFKPLKPVLYVGKIAKGTPYFFPRKWVKDKSKPGYLTAISKVIGFDFVDLGWKTKFNDYRFEWSPMWSFVFFRWQVALTFVAPHTDHYWESWLYYEYRTDKTKSKKERLKECMSLYSNIWTSYNKDGSTESINYYKLILRKKYLHLNEK